MHCPGHQKPVDPVSRGNHFADQTAKRIALSPAQAMAVQLPDPGPRDLPPVAEYAEEDLQWVEKLPMAQLLEEWWRDSKCRTVLPEKLGEEVLHRVHGGTHPGARRRQDLTRQAALRAKEAASENELIVAGRKVCQLTTAGRNSQSSGARQRGDKPGTYWEVDFTEVKPAKYGDKYLLVFVDTFSGRVEAVPTKSEMAQVVAKKILEDILPGMDSQ